MLNVKQPEQKPMAQFSSRKWDKEGERCMSMGLKDAWRRDGFQTGSSTALKRPNLIRNKNNQLQLLIGMWINNQWQLAPKSPFKRSSNPSALVTGKSSVLKESQSDLWSELCFNHFLYIFALFSIMFSFVWVIAQLLNIPPWYESANSKFKCWKENLNIQLLVIVAQHSICKENW